MRPWFLSAVALFILTETNADNTDRRHLTYDPGDKHSEISPRLSHIRFEGQNSEKPVKFEDSEKQYRPLDDVTVDNDDDNRTRNSAIKFDDNLNDDATKIKFEDTNGFDEITNAERGVPELLDNSLAEPIVFEGQSSDKNPVRIEKPPTKRKPRLKAQKGNSSYKAENSRYPGNNHPSRPGVRLPGNLNTGYLDYQGYAGYGYGYPHYSSPYSGYTIPNYPGHLPRPLPPYQGYGLYPPVGYPRPGDSRPPVTPGQNNQNGNPDVKFPDQHFGGQTNLGPSQNGNPYPGLYPYQGSPGPGYNQGYGYYAPAHPGRPVPNGQYISTRRPKSLTQRAVSAVAEALTSIALYDDQQCVPRLLCEMASGSAAASASSSLLKYTAGLEPLLTLLQAYNGASTSPLYLFARAAVLGMTAKGNPSNCYQSYPQCPRDPVKLVNYLNNHNGGFFRFFGQPTKQPQNLDQFYNYLAGNHQNLQSNKPYSYGLLNPSNNNQNYGSNNYGYQNFYKNADDETFKEIQDRIQNKPAVNDLEEENNQYADDEDGDTKWRFPDEVNSQTDRNRNRLRDRVPFKIKNEVRRPQRASKTLKFPDDINNFNPSTNEGERENFSKLQNTFFPGENKVLYNYNINYQTTTPENTNDYVFDHKHNFYVKRPKAVRNDDLVYIVRGNGDPNHPEIVKLRPGQSLR